MGERGRTPLILNLCTRCVFGFTPGLPYPWVKSRKEPDYAIELFVTAAQERKIFACDTMWIA
jgi:hypothetical protein